MSSTFWALRVGGGESFLLRTSSEGGRPFFVLVDSGYSGRKLVRALNDACPGLERIDVAICTHQDRDHSGGFKNFADLWAAEGKRLIEYWLPGSWASAFPSVLGDAQTLIGTIMRGARELPAHLSDLEGETFEERLRCFANSRGPSDEQDQGRLSAISTEERRFRRNQRAFGLDSSVASIVSDVLEDQSFDEDFLKELHSLGRDHGWYPSDDPVWSAVQTVILRRTIDAALSIRRIAHSALRNNVKVRWFDFSAFELMGSPAGGRPRVLLPVNSREIYRPPPPDAMFMVAKLYLSRQNVESLVFMRPETASEPAVLFLGDSRLAFGEHVPGRAFRAPSSSPTRPAIVTAPHHGSSTNDHAYSVLRGWGVDPRFVRNGGHHKSKLTEFRTAKYRRCAHCQQCFPHRSQIVEVDGTVDWDWANVSARRCP